MSEGTLDEVFRDEWGRLLALLVAQFRRLDLAEDGLSDAFLAAAAHWPVDGMPGNPAGWLLTTARRKILDRLRGEATAARKEPLLVVDAELQQKAQRVMADVGDMPAGRAAPVDVPQCPPGAGSGRRGRAHLAAGRRCADGRHRRGLSHGGAGHGGTADPGEADRGPLGPALRRPGGPGPAAPAGHGLPSDLPGLHDGVRAGPRRRGDPQRGGRRGDPARSAADRTAAGATGGADAAGPDAAAALPARCPDRHDGSAGAAARPGSIALAVRRDRGGACAPGADAARHLDRLGGGVLPAGPDRRRTCRRCSGRGHALGPDRGALRRARGAHRFARWSG